MEYHVIEEKAKQSQILRKYKYKNCRLKHNFTKLRFG